MAIPNAEELKILLSGRDPKKMLVINKKQSN